MLLRRRGEAAERNCRRIRVLVAGTELSPLRGQVKTQEGEIRTQDRKPKKKPGNCSLEERNKYKGFGSIITKESIDKKNPYATLLVTLNPDVDDDGSGAVLLPPKKWTPIWSGKSSSFAVHHISRPVCENGYVALGDTAHILRIEGYGKRFTWCLRQDYASRGKVDKKPSFWVMDGDRKINIWRVLAKSDIQGSQNVPLYTGTFLTTVGPNPPDAEDIWTLAVPIERNFQPFQANPSDLEYNMLPPDGTKFETKPQGLAVLPLTNMFRPRESMILRHMDVPFGKISKSVGWVLDKVIRNEGKLETKTSTTITYGISKERTTMMEHTAGISVSASVGIGVIFSSSISLNYQFSYSTSSTFSEYESVMKTRELTVPGEGVTAIFSKWPLVQVELLDGTLLDSITGSDVSSFATKDIRYP